MEEDRSHLCDEPTSVPGITAESVREGGQRLFDRTGVERAHAAEARRTCQRREEASHLGGAEVSDHQPARVHALCLLEQRRQIRAVVDAEAHAERAIAQRRQVGAVHDGDKTLIHTDDLEEGVEERRLAGAALAEDKERAAVVGQAPEADSLLDRECPGVDQRTQRRGQYSRPADPFGIHHGGVRRQDRASRDKVLEVGAYLRAERGAQHVEVLAQGFGVVDGLDPVDGRADLLDELVLDGAQRLGERLRGHLSRRSRRRALVHRLRHARSSEPTVLGVLCQWRASSELGGSHAGSGRESRTAWASRLPYRQSPARA